MTKAQFDQMVVSRGFISLIVYYTNQFGETLHICYDYNPFTVTKELAVARALAKLNKFARTRREDVVSYRIHTENEFDYQYKEI